MSTKQFEGVKFNMPEGRLVNGHPMTMRDKKNYNTKQPELDKNGQVRKQVLFKVAYPEQVFLQAVWPYLQQAAAQGFGGQPIPQNFKWKVKHCNDLDKNGKRYGDREGCEGCYIVTYSTEAFTPKVFKQTTPNAFVEITNPEELKTGYHVVVEAVARHNGNYGDTGGLYINPSQVLLTRYDSEIVSNAADPNEAFGGMTQYVLQGAPAGGQHAQGGFPQQQGGYAPQGAPMGQQQQGGFPQAGYAPQGMPQGAPAGMPQGMPQGAPMGNGQPHGAYAQAAPTAHAGHATTYPSNVPPAHDFVNNAVGGQPQGMPQPQAAPMGQQFAPQGMPQGMPQGAPAGMPQGMPQGAFPQR